MFEVPEWGDDTPKNGISFAKSLGKVKKKNTESKKIGKVTQKKKTPIKPDIQTKNNKPYIKSNPAQNTKKQVNDNKTMTNRKPGGFVSRPAIKSSELNKVVKVDENKNRPKRQNKKPHNETNNKSTTDYLNSIHKAKAIKRKHQNEESETNFDPDRTDEEIINVKKKKFIEAFKNDDQEDVLFAPAIKKKQMIVKNMLKIHASSNRSSIKPRSSLRERMLEKLKAAQFRYLNEKLYTSSGADAQKLFQSDPVAFQTYHEGFQQQVKKWPMNPLDVIVRRIKKMPKTHLVADMGCGEAALSRRISQRTRSFDLVAAAAGVEACDMAHTPLLAASVDVAVYCLALMGTELTKFLLEANRVLKIGGHLLIAEVESRFDKVEDFCQNVERLGFKLKNLDKAQQVFYFIEFTKIRDPPVKKIKLPELTLKPCLYKRR